MTEADGEINQDFINCYNKMVLYFQLPGTQRISSRTGSKQHCQGLHSTTFCSLCEGSFPKGCLPAMLLHNHTISYRNIITQLFFWTFQLLKQS